MRGGREENNKKEGRNGCEREWVGEKRRWRVKETEETIEKRRMNMRGQGRERGMLYKRMRVKWREVGKGR